MKDANFIFIYMETRCKGVFYIKSGIPDPVGQAPNVLEVKDLIKAYN